MAWNGAVEIETRPKPVHSVNIVNRTGNMAYLDARCVAPGCEWSHGDIAQIPVEMILHEHWLHQLEELSRR